MFRHVMNLKFQLSSGGLCTHAILSASISISYFLRIFTFFFNLHLVLPTFCAMRPASFAYSRWLISHWFPVLSFTSIAAVASQKASSNIKSNVRLKKWSFSFDSSSPVVSVVVICWCYRCTSFQLQGSWWSRSILPLVSDPQIARQATVSGLVPFQWMSMRQG